MMAHFICATCGTQFGTTTAEPDSCPICEDERQYVPGGGQRWTTLDDLRITHSNRIEEVEPGLIGIGTEPAFAIGQRALLVQTPGGNVMWDCVSLLAADTIALVRARGGIKAIAISHPHYYSSMVEWSRTFDAPIYLHSADREWVMRSDGAIHFWDGETYPLWDGMTLVRVGGHFAGGTVLHWAAGGMGQGAILSGDIVMVVPDAGWVSFMYSYPNLIPLPVEEVQRVAVSVEPFEFDRIYGAWWDRVLLSGGKAAVARSAQRYMEVLERRGERRFR
jgi:hypothetical protein